MPSWYGLRYPTLEDLEAHAEHLGACVVWTRARCAAFDASGPAIYIPKDTGPLKRAWNLAHELGHLVRHTGPKGRLLYSKGEAQADRWAVCALIPQSRINLHQNASPDAFIAALSAHFGDIPLEDCPERRLAARIARIRLKIMEVRP